MNVVNIVFRHAINIHRVTCSANGLKVLKVAEGVLRSAPWISAKVINTDRAYNPGVRIKPPESDCAAISAGLAGGFDGLDPNACRIKITVVGKVQLFSVSGLFVPIPKIKQILPPVNVAVDKMFMAVFGAACQFV